MVNEMKLKKQINILKKVNCEYTGELYYITNIDNWLLKNFPQCKEIKKLNKKEKSK